MNRSADWLHQAMWGHGLGRSFRDLPPSVAAQLGTAVTDLEDRLRILDALYIPTRYPDSLPDGAPPTTSAVCRATTPFAMPVRSLTQSVLRWPEPDEVLRHVNTWAQEQAARVPSLEGVAVFGSYGRGTAGVGSDLDLLLIDAAASGPQHERLRRWPLELLPLSCDARWVWP
ncbi:MAG: nucleotidyltransferase domain-containing protein [Prochlorococcaceae cyanobacterium]